MDLETARATFLDPPVTSRPVPFWFWNDHLDPDRLVWQYDRLVEAGAGGAVLHARGGLDSAEYLDERWFAAVDAVVEHAAKKGTVTWIYDELGWPSGSAGGRMGKLYPDLMMWHLRMHDLTPQKEGDLDPMREGLVAAFVVTRSDPGHGICQRTNRGAAATGSVTLLLDRIHYEPIPLPLEPAHWLGNRLLLFTARIDEMIINYLDPRATEAFLETTHAEYYRRFGKHFGTTITHSFMDEAGMFLGPAMLPWREDLPKIFEKRRGYAMGLHLPKLFFDLPDAEAFRFDFWSLAAELFREGFGYPMHRWCGNHRIAYSGHYVYETTLKEAQRQLGSTMPLYEYQGLPGIDVLGNDFYSYRFEREAYAYYLVMIKQAASVSNQLDKGGLMSESYGVGGHAMGPESMQTATNFQMALGVTMICQHAAFYSMRAERKLDCPPAIDWHEPYWPFVKKHLDATARTGWLLNQGRRVVDTLVIHPAASMQATYRHFRTRAEYKTENYLFDADLPFETIDKHVSLLSVNLLDAQVDFEFGDEELMARYAAVEGDRLRIGRCNYRLVVLPPSVNIRSSTLALLKTFAGRGGRIVAIGSAPRLVDGRPSTEARDFLAASATRVTDGVDHFDYSTAIAELAALGARTVTLRTLDGGGAPSIKVHRRVWGDREVMYLANISREPVKARLSCTVGVTGHVEEWEPATGEVRPLAPCTTGGELALDLEWAPRQARAFVAIPGAVEIPAPVPRIEKQRIRPTWTGRRTARNVLLLDLCRVMEGGRPGEPVSVWQVHERFGSGKRAAGGHLTAQFPFSLATVPAGKVELAIELGGAPRLALNGAPVSLDSTGWIMDPAIRTFALSGLRAGENVLEVEGNYAKALDFQIPWLVGYFRVTTKDDIAFVAEPGDDAIGIGAWHRVGLPFYAGTVSYRAEVDLPELPAAARVVLDMAGLAGSAQVRVNGAVVDHVLWPPYACDLTGRVAPGRAVIEVEVANTLRNMLGAHYDEDEENHTGASDRSYRGVAGQRKRFRDYGLLAAPEIVISGRA